MVVTVVTIITAAAGCLSNSHRNPNVYNKKWLAFLTKAKKENKYIVLEFYTSWCVPCKILQSQVLDNDSVAHFLNQKVVFLSVNAEKDMGIALSMKYSITAYPTVLIFNSMGTLVYEEVGIEDINDPNLFLNKIRSIFMSGNTLPANGLSHELMQSYPNFYISYYTKKMQPDSITISNYFKLQTNMFSEVNWSVIRVFGKTSNIQNYITQNIDKFISLYGSMVKNFIKTTIQNSIANDYNKKDSSQFKKDIYVLMKIQDTMSAKALAHKKYLMMLSFWAQTGLDWGDFLSCWKIYRTSYGADLDIYAAKLVDEHCQEQNIRNLAEYILEQRIKQNPHDWEGMVGLANLLQREDVPQVNVDESLTIHSNILPGLEKPMAEDLYERAIKEANGSETIISNIVYERIQSGYFIPNIIGWNSVMSFDKKYLPEEYKHFFRFYTIGYYRQQKNWSKFTQYVNGLCKQTGGFQNIHGINARTFAIYAIDILQNLTETNQIKAAIGWMNGLIKNNSDDPNLIHFVDIKKSLQSKLDSLSDHG